MVGPSDKGFDSWDKGNWNKMFMVWDYFIKRENKTHAAVTKSDFSLNHLPLPASSKLNERLTDAGPSDAEIEKMRQIIHHMTDKSKPALIGMIPVKTSQLYGIGWQHLNRPEVHLRPSDDPPPHSASCQSPYELAFAKLIADAFPGGLPADFHLQDYERLFFTLQAQNELQERCQVTPLQDNHIMHSRVLEDNAIAIQEAKVIEAFENLSRFLPFRTAYFCPRTTSPEVEYATEFFKTRGVALYLKKKHER